ncbi:MAG: NADH-dependent alcohol dehydrogenase, partial [Clostridia bacterium]|nr:NADH-dependent alcohol dehydrogenase [Clostridia bacterium]
AEKVWGVKEADAGATAKTGVCRTVGFFSSIGMPTSLSGLGIEPSDADLRALALDATANGTLMLSRIKPLGVEEVERIFRRAVLGV